MHARPYVVSSLFKIFFPHSNILKQLGSLTTGSCVTEGYSYFASLFEYFSLLTFVWAHYDSISSVEISSAMMPFDLSSYVEQTRGKVLSTMNSFDSLLSVEKTYEAGICFVPVIYVLKG